MIGTSPTASGAGALDQVFFWSAVLLVVAIAGGAVILLARRFMKRGNGDAETGFTLHELRGLHDSGRISDDEFERAKAQLISRVRAPSDKQSE